MQPSQIDSFIEAYVEAIHNQNAAVFAGAGLSIPSGMVDWKNLLRSIAKDIGLDVDKEDDLISLAQFHVNERGGRHRINQAMINEFSDRASLTENHRLLASLPIRIYWTTNYDNLIEESLRNTDKKPDVKATVENIATTVPRRDAVVYKMHGDISLPDKAIVTKDDYEKYETTHHLFSLALQGDLVSKTFLFIGFSFSDPNLNYILSRIRVLLGENRREHYCLLRRLQRSDFRNNRDFQYALAKQDLQVHDLKRYGIIGLLVDDYNSYTNILQRITQKHQMSRVFISGSAANYDPWTNDEAQQLIQEIACRLIQKGFGVSSGFGLGVGSHVVNGVLEQLEQEGTRIIDDRIILRPFPLNIADPSDRKRRWTAYREDMLSNVGIALFLFGNKLDSSGNVTLADGIREEFSIAVSRGIFVIPIGSTGSIAQELFSEVLHDYDKYFPMRGFKTFFKDLNRKETPKRTASKIVDLIIKLRNKI